MFALSPLALPLLVQVQGSDTVQQTIVTATRRPTTPFEVPYSTDEVSAEQIERRSYRTTPQALRDIPGVMVQETAHGQGSPYIRGFTGFRNLFLIDGIRLNNSVFRDGPNQYWNTVDPFSVERLEVVKGPSSVLYGSDAIGGTVNAVTKSPYGMGGRILYRYADAESSHMGRAEGSASLWDGRGGLLVGGSLKELGDLEGGESVGTMPETGYDERDLDVKIDRLIGDDKRLVLAHQRVRQYDVPRTHKTIYSQSWKGTTLGSDLKRDLDQSRDLTYAQLQGESSMVSLSWHEQGEERHRIKGSGATEEQGFDVGTLGVLAQHSTESGVGRLTYGFDYYRDEVDSFSSANPIQGPVADDAAYDQLGVFLQDELDASDALTFIFGARFNYAAADANRVSDPVSGLPISIDEEWSALVGSARFLYRITEETWNLFGGISQGFRAPNLSDLTRFDSARTNEFEIPSPDLDPEHYLTVELGVKTEQADVTAEVSVFYTDIRDQIVRFPTGNTNAAGEFEITKDNVGDGHVYGAELGAAWTFYPEWTLFGNAAYLEGQVETYPTSAQVRTEEVIDRLLPLRAQAGVRWEQDGTWVEALGMYAVDADRLSTRDQGDTSRIPPGGTPAYAVLHVHAGIRVNENIELHAGVDNVFDEDYRVHGSGQNMPGRNIIVGAGVSF
jgi:hemoglobin/transferrin/lactoferrin receptor protein